LILVCRNNFKLNAGISVCDLQHKRCSQCPPSGCILCQFYRLRSWGNITFDDLPPAIQPIVGMCDALEKKFEETQQLNLNNVNVSYDRQDSTIMDVDYNPVPIESKFFLSRLIKKNFFLFNRFIFTKTKHTK
jgi:hypothetical protein